MPPPRGESVLLVEQSGALRVYVTRDPQLSTIVERAHVAVGQIHERIWYWQHGERALTGQKIFREGPATPRPDDAECPLYDETRVTLLLPDEVADLTRRGLKLSDAD